MKMHEDDKVARSWLVGRVRSGWPCCQRRILSMQQW